ncbi:hypothetical protein QJQ45_005085 [Haematococcus lacustris]|nr:hypothetical protein QJQ45_005085 [Haematococcus lacustris]
MDPRLFIDEFGVRRLRNTEFVLPIVVGTIAFHLGKKVRFDLHHTFSNANRLVDHQPFEVTEHGWGEFDIVIHVMFTPDSSENEVILYHKLKLYEDGEQPGSRQDPKRPVVSETLEELVFYEPRADFYQRLVSYRPQPLHPLPQLAPYFQTPNEALELELISSWRTKVATVSNDMRREIMALHGTLPMGLAQGGQGRISPLPALPPLPGM